MALTERQSKDKGRILTDILSITAPEKMGWEDAIEFYEELIADIETYADALNEENKD